MSLVATVVALVLSVGIAALGALGVAAPDRLLALGGTVVGVDGLITSDGSNLAHLADEPGFTFVEADIIEGIPVEGSFDVVANLASPASPPDYLREPLLTLRTGATGTDRALDVVESLLRLDLPDVGIPVPDRTLAGLEGCKRKTLDAFRPCRFGLGPGVKCPGHYRQGGNRDRNNETGLVHAFSNRWQGYIPETP